MLVEAKPSWRIRRRIIVAALIFCAAEIVYLTVWGKDTRLSETIANGIIILAGSVIGAYVFGAVWDDKNVMAMSRGRKQRVEVETEDAPAEPPKDFAG
jgi:quinol-cytochrome oxidoreductase complex cytochrome b subunit